jgi:hypothetical protein
MDIVRAYIGLHGNGGSAVTAKEKLERTSMHNKISLRIYNTNYNIFSKRMTHDSDKNSRNLMFAPESDVFT